MRLKKRISTALVTALVLPLGLGVSFGAGAVEEVVDTVYVDRASFFPVEVKGTETVANQYNGWHQGDNNGAGNYKFTDEGIELTAKAQILYGNDGEGAEAAISANAAEVARSLAIAGSNTADVWYQVPVFFGDLEGSPSFTTLRKFAAAEGDVWTTSGPLPGFAKGASATLDELVTALDEHLVIGYGFFVDTGKSASVSSFTALGVEHSFAKAPVVSDGSKIVDRDAFFPEEVDGLYNGWHQGHGDGVANYEFTDEGISLSNIAQILYGNDGKGAEDAIAANVAEVAGSLAVAGENTADLWYQIPVFFGDLEGSPSFTTLRKPVTATDEQWTVSRAVGGLAANTKHDLTVINTALGEHLVIGYGFYAGIGSTAQVTSFTALGVEHKFTPAPVVPEPQEPETPDPKPAPKPTPPPAANFEQVVPSGDLNGDGFADLLAVDNSGVLWLYPGKSGDAFSKPVRLGSGWSNRVISSPGDFNGDGIGDLIAVDDKGDLYFYPGKGNGNFGAANQAGWGWGDLEIIPAGDVTGDGVSDVLAIDSDGFLYYYAGDGNGRFKGKLTKVGQGWYGYDLYPAGDINGDGFADILSIDRNGNLFTHLGKEGGAFRKSFQSGKGWSTYELFAGSDANGDGLADLYGRDSKGDLYFYAGKPSGGFRTAVLVGKGW